MEQIELKSQWLAHALNIDQNSITLNELKEIKMLNFDLVEYINSNNDVAILDETEYNKAISNSERISKTNEFLSELLELSQYLDLSYVDINGLNLQDSNLDCLYNFPNLQSLELKHNDNANIDLQKFKNLKTMNIYLEDCETEFVDISRQTAKSIGVYDKPTQYDMYKSVRRKSFEEMPIKFEDLSSFKPYTVNIPSICVNTVEDVEKIRNEYKTANFSINTNELKDLKELKDICEHVNSLINDFPDKYSFTQSINDISELNTNQLNIMKESLNEICRFDSVNVLRTFDEYEEYDIQTYTNIREMSDIILNQVDNNLPEAKKALQIEKILASNIAYDRDTFIKSKNEQVDGKSINLEDGLLNGKCVCGGFADIYRNILACCNIDAKTVNCLSEGNGHSYNQVKIDNKWYNTDLTYDIYEILSGGEMNCCLQSDDNFRSTHKLDGMQLKYGNVEKCTDTYNQEELNSYNRNNINFVEPMTVISSLEGNKEAIDQYVNNTGVANQRNIRSDILDIYNDGLNLCFAYNDEDKYKVVFGGKDNISTALDNSPSFVTEEHLVEMVKLFLDRYEKSNRGQTDGSITMIKNDEGLNLVLGEVLIEKLQDYGIFLVKPDIEEENEVSEIDNVLNSNDEREM